MGEYTRLIYEATDAARLKRTLEAICGFHRIQASPGYRKAANYCIERAREAGLEARLLEYPAEEGVMFENMPSFEAWECGEAWCEFVSTGERIADFSADPYSLIQRSGAWKQSDRELEVIDLDRGTKEAAYAGVDFEGRLVFVHDEFSLVRDWAIEKRGAVGYISDYVAPESGVRTRYDMLDAKKYTSFWWRPGQKRVFGFVLTPRRGDELAALCNRLAREGKRPRVRCYVDAKLMRGKTEVVSVSLPGQEAGEALIVAHLCHPYSSANDNASGATAALEGLCTLKRLIESCRLPKPRKTMRVLLTPEIFGTYAYLDGLSEVERKDILIGLTLDMVGAKQGADAGPLTVYETPHWTPGIANPLSQRILSELRRDVPALNITDRLPMFNSFVSEYIEGSDHGLLNDPSCAIPSPLVCQWPDKFYHTSADTPERIDYALLRHSAALAGAYAYAVTSLTADDLPSLFAANYARMVESLTRLMAEAREAGMGCEAFDGLFFYYADYYAGNIADAPGLVPPNERAEAERMVETEQARLRLCAKLTVAAFATTKPVKRSPLKKYTLPEYSYVPTRSFLGRFDFGLEHLRYDPAVSVALDEYREFAKACGAGDYETPAISYMDNHRTLAEIAALTALELRQDCIEYIDAYVKLLAKAGLVQLTEAQEG